MEKIIVLLNKLISKLKVFRRGLYYVGGNDALPPPLSKESSAKMVRARCRSRFIR